MKIRFNPFFCWIILSSLTACGSSGSGSKPIPKPVPLPSAGIAQLYQGKWLNEPEGRGLHINGSDVIQYEYTSEFCLRAFSLTGISTDEFESRYRIREGVLEPFADNGTATFSAPATPYQKVDRFPNSCEQSVTASLGEAGYVRDPQRDLRLYYQLISEYSIYPGLRSVNLEERYFQQDLLLSKDSTDGELASALFELTLPFADIHQTVEGDFGFIKVLNKPSFHDLLIEEALSLEMIAPPLDDAQVETVNNYVSQQLQLDRAIIRSYAEDSDLIKQSKNGVLTWFITNNIGYLAIDAMIGFGDVEDNSNELFILDADLDNVFYDLQDVDAMVVDVRRNGGGKDFLSLAIASRFAPNETLVYRKQSRVGSVRGDLSDVRISPRGTHQYFGPVWLLTSATTASAAEVFTLAMRELDQVVIVGEATQGGFSDQLDKVLSNGFAVSVANEFYLSPDNEFFETLGVPVDIMVPQFTYEARQAGIDTSLSTVIELLSD